MPELVTAWSVSAVHHILVPTDLFEDVETARTYAEALAKDTGAALHFVHVVTSSLQNQKFGQEAERRSGHSLEDEVQGALDSLVIRARERGAAATASMPTGLVEAELRGMVDALSIDLVVMCTGDRLNTDELVVSKYVKVIRDSSVPVLGVKQSTRTFLDSSSGRLSIKKVLCPCDLTEFSQSAVAVAADVCKHFDAELILGHVAHTYDEFAAIDGKGGTPENPVDTQDVLGRLLEPYNALAARVIAVKGDLKSALTEICVNEDVDLVVMATHGQNPLLPSLVASFTQKFLVGAPCPVLTVRPELLAARYGG